MTEEKTVTHVKCECGQENEIILLFELAQDLNEPLKCVKCGLHFDKKLLTPFAKKVLERRFKEKDKFKTQCNDDKLYEHEMDRYIKLYDKLNLVK